MNGKRPRLFPSAYDREPDLLQMVRRYAGRGEKREHLDAIARRAYSLTGWAGRPIPWDERTETVHEQAREHARWALRNVSMLEHHHAVVCCVEHGTHAIPHRGCVLR